MTKNNSMQNLGKAGEMIVANYFASLGQKIKISVDQFDSKKDMLVEEETIEVKTQVPFVNKNSFTIKENQLKKCKTVNKVIFISVPNKHKPHFSEGKAFVIESDKMKFSEYVTKDGRKMILIPISQPEMKELFVLSENDCKTLQKYSVSSWN